MTKSSIKANNVSVIIIIVIIIINLFQCGLKRVQSERVTMTNW